MTRLDGNALAGPLAGYFEFDPTMALGRCDNCGDTRPFGACIVFNSAMGAVMRCAVCDAVLMTHVAGPGITVVNTRGLTWVRVNHV